MADVRLPPELVAAIEDFAAGQGASARESAARLSVAYRGRVPSASAVAEDADVAAYLRTRMPATYAALTAVLAEAAGRAPDFAPTSLLDAGAGPGTASWAALTAWPELQRLTLIDNNAGLLDAARGLAGAGPAPLAAATFVAGEINRPPVGPFDVVVAGYSLTELPDGLMSSVALALWERCAGLLVIVEPGRPRDYARLMAVRAALFAAGAKIVAPCPHERPCPLPDGDWCHFSVRLPRLRAHRQAKGGTLGYEDEKFSYLVVARPEVAARPATARVIRPPVQRKFEVELALCADGGLGTRAVAKRDPAFRAARKLDCGDAWD